MQLKDTKQDFLVAVLIVLSKVAESIESVERAKAIVQGHTEPGLLTSTKRDKMSSEVMSNTSGEKQEPLSYTENIQVHCALLDRCLCNPVIYSHINLLNPLSPGIIIQILLTGLHTFH